jgi:hypothetical protein
VVKHNCRASSSLILKPYPVGAGSAFVGLANCPVIPGNSGSPLINEQGSAQGIVWGTTWISSIGLVEYFRISQLETYFNIESLASKSIHLGMGTPFHCVPDSSEAHKFDAYPPCKTFLAENSENKEAFRAALRKDLRNLILRMTREALIDITKSLDPDESQRISEIQFDSDDQWESTIREVEPYTDHFADAGDINSRNFYINHRVIEIHPKCQNNNREPQTLKVVVKIFRNPEGELMVEVAKRKSHFAGAPLNHSSASHSLQINWEPLSQVKRFLMSQCPEVQASL